MTLPKVRGSSWDLSEDDGITEGRDLPPFIPLGTDAFAKANAHCEMTLKILEDWEDVIKSTMLTRSSRLDLCYTALTARYCVIAALNSAGRPC